MPKDDDIRRVDNWALICRFNSGYFTAALQAGEIYEKRSRIGDPDPSVGLPIGSESVKIKYLVKGTNAEVAEFHCYVLPDKTIAASGLLDPKRLKIGAVWERRIKGEDESMRDPCLLFPRWGKLRLRYANFRRWICRQWGPDVDRKIAAVTTPILRGLFFFTKSTSKEHHSARPVG
jgi:hypothetical protein